MRLPYNFVDRNDGNDAPMPTYLVTGNAGFIGFHTARTLLEVQLRNLAAGSGAAAAEGMSVMGFVGTAESRLNDADEAGLIRVKTGSLGDVTSMTGNVSRLNGGALTFAVIVNNPTDFAAAKAAIDTFVAGLPKL